MNIILAEAVWNFGNFLVVILMIRVIMSWIPFNPDGVLGKIFGILSAFTEPFVSPIRRLIQRSPLGGPGMMIDFSPMLAFLAIRLITTLLANFLRNM
ncbi:MAG: YggT family protein [Clostridiales bacterium]|nr:YggT family protein [Clostridiales bacterium]